MNPDSIATRVCPICGVAKSLGEFYRTSSYCKPCHKQRSLEYRARPDQQAKMRAAKNAWLKLHPEVNRRNVAAYRARHKEVKRPSFVPQNRALVREAVSLLHLTKQRIQQLIDHGQLSAIRQRGRWLIDRSALDCMVEERKRNDAQRKSMDEEG